MDTKLKADIAELAVTKELLARGYNVLMTSKNSLRSWHRVVDFKEIFYTQRQLTNKIRTFLIWQN